MIQTKLEEGCLIEWSWRKLPVHFVKIEREGLLCKETNDTVILFAPPLVISQ
jgi:acetylornithine/succinyldiaminopimelate/putrescine aminotransferase